MSAKRDEPNPEFEVADPEQAMRNLKGLVRKVLATPKNSPTPRRANRLTKKK